ncbi:hypothetical protein [Daejeonella rubra]|uniref:hypothetical protein n=1 Tax=Daejeonella rubra TaxID=990371 RepID=UPI000B876940|nr:hypothetical protein [Daejeonella rubra]
MDTTTFKLKQVEVARVLEGIPLAEAKDLLYAIAESLEEMAVIKAPASVEFKETGQLNINRLVDD